MNIPRPTPTTGVIDKIDLHGPIDKVKKGFEEVLRAQCQQLQNLWALVMPSKGMIYIATLNGFTAFECDQDPTRIQESLVDALYCTSFFTPASPPLIIPAELVTPVPGVDKHYLVTKTLLPFETTWRCLTN